MRPDGSIWGLSAVRAVTRLLVSLGLLVSAVSLTPLASAAPDPSASSTGDSSASASQTTDPGAAGSSADPSASSSGTGGAAPSGGASGSPSAKSLSGTSAAAGATNDPSLATTIDADPGSFSVDTTPTFSYRVSSTDANLKFRCTLVRKGATTRAGDCSSGNRPASGGTAGSTTYSGALATSPDEYTFTVQAYIPAVSGGAEERSGQPATFAWHLYSVRSPQHYPVATQATFNNPLGTKAAQRRNLTRVIRAINSMPGYAEPADTSAPCPSAQSPYIPSKIRVSLYSMTDGIFARAMLAADKRCVSVQILMNNHLSAATDGAWRMLLNGLGNTRKARSFAYRCGYGCRGRSVLHTKMYLFDSSVPAPLDNLNVVNDRVMVGSANITSNSSRIQWNDLYGVKNSTMFKQYSSYFDLMKLDNGFRRNPHDYVAAGGRYRTTFWPVAANRPEPYLKALRAIRCKGATGGTGINGRSVVYINMHAWFGLRGLAIQRAVRTLYSHGCYIRILYSFMTPKVHYLLTHGTGSRMSARRTVFSLDGDRYADVYSHFKSIAASGNISGDSSNRVVYTGSNNFTSDGDHFDEVMLRIHRKDAYRQYRDQFKFISKRMSSARWASFFDAKGGGRAPTTTKFMANLAPNDAPVVLSPQATIAPDGTPRVLD